MKWTIDLFRHSVRGMVAPWQWEMSCGKGCIAWDRHYRHRALALTAARRFAAKHGFTVGHVRGDGGER